jgi:NAD(P)-dependent dehydrogenase (short-subunit alcohol dehydrogenase family)
MSYNLQGKTALVTGATSGIGKAILTALADEGCNVIIHHLKKSPKIKKLKREIEKRGQKVWSFSADLTDENKVSSMFKEIKKEIKKLDILVNNVGNYLKTDLEKLTIKQWHEILDSNLHSTFYCMHYALPLLRAKIGGKVVNIGYASSGLMVAKPKILPYQISKTGILLLTKAYALNEAKNNILINMISPGVMENSVHQPTKEIPIGRTGKLKELAEVVIQTIKNSYITGAHIEFAGGFNL